jgi:hypothetical protein
MTTHDYLIASGWEYESDTDSYRDSKSGCRFRKSAAKHIQWGRDGKRSYPEPRRGRLADGRLRSNKQIARSVGTLS